MHSTLPDTPSPVHEAAAPAVEVELHRRRLLAEGRRPRCSPSQAAHLVRTHHGPQHPVLLRLQLQVQDAGLKQGKVQRGHRRWGEQNPKKKVAQDQARWENHVETNGA